MDESHSTIYWCHRCSQTVNPIMDIEIKCPHCLSGFVEETAHTSDRDNNRGRSNNHGFVPAQSLWTSFLLRPIDSSSPHPSLSTQIQASDQDTTFHSSNRRPEGASSVIHSGEDATENIGNERVILISSSNRAIILRGLTSPDVGMSLGDYLIGPGLERLLQHLAENDPNRRGTPPARKEAVEALPRVKLEETMSCSVCLDELEAGAEGREMPCKHKFHEGCLLPWLELHSTCPVCRFQIPADEAKGSGGGVDGNEVEGGERSNGGNWRRFWLPLLWPFSGLLSHSGLRQNDEDSAADRPPSLESGSNRR